MSIEFTVSSIFLTYITKTRREIYLKVIRCYASQKNALNARTIIQDLLVSELERMIDQPEKNLLDKNKKLGSECA